MNISSRITSNIFILLMNYYRHSEKRNIKSKVVPKNEKKKATTTKKVKITIN